MLPYTGDYTEHIDPEKPSLTFYSFTPRPLMRGDMYQMDDELAALLIEAHRNIGFLEGLTYCGFGEDDKRLFAIRGTLDKR